MVVRITHDLLHKYAVSLLSHWHTGIYDDACGKCQTWYDSPEEADDSWRTTLNSQIPCPCNVNIGLWSLTPTDPSAADDWKIDWACVAWGLPLCWRFHPGAHGCLRSKASTTDGAGQQCCYDASGVLLPPEHPGAGSPDKAVRFREHQDVDVKPAMWCCEGCPSMCDRYKEKRRGDNSHCK